MAHITKPCFLAHLLPTDVLPVDVTDVLSCSEENYRTILNTAKILTAVNVGKYPCWRWLLRRSEPERETEVPECIDSWMPCGEQGDSTVRCLLRGFTQQQPWK